MPLVSVIMPAFNAAPFLDRAIESVLAQSFRDIELIIVDDASTDKTPEVLYSIKARHAKRVKILRQSVRSGPAGARNAGLAVCSGDYVLFTDADDIQHPNRIERSLAVLSRPSPPAMVFVDCEMIDAKENPLHRQKGYPQAFCDETALLFQLERNHLWVGLCMMRRLPEMRFDESLLNSEDYEFFLRLLISGQRLDLIRDTLVQYRLHGHNNSADHKLANDCVRKILSQLDYNELVKDLMHRHSEPDVRIAVAAALLSCERPREALEQLGEVVAPVDAERAFKWEFIAGVASYQVGEMMQSRNYFFRVHERTPTEPAVLNNIGVLTAIVDQNFQRAMDYFNKAVTARPGYNDAERNLCNVINGSNDLRLTPRPLREALIHTKNYV